MNIFLPVNNPSPRILAQAVCLYLGIDPERVFAPCRRATGSITEACRMLLRNMEAGARADAIRPDTDIPPRVAEVVAMLREGWRPVSGRMASAHAAHALVEEGGGCHPPLRARLLLLYISPPSYTLGIRGTDGAYIPIGKVDSLADLPADERTKLHKRAKALITESFGPTSLLTPDIVVEARFSHVEANPRTKAKKVLRNVAITRICWGESIESIATLESL
ncbi:MAG: hypothetical protein RL177_1376 [Bacteroidota bacterium]